MSLDSLLIVACMSSYNVKSANIQAQASAVLQDLQQKIKLLLSVIIPVDILPTNNIEHILIHTIIVLEDMNCRCLG